MVAMKARVPSSAGSSCVKDLREGPRARPKHAMPEPKQIKTTRRTYTREKVASLAPWLRGPVPPTLVFSDTHLVPCVKAWTDDAPEDLLALFQALSGHELLSLGDLTESVGLRRAQRAQLFRCERLRPLWGLMRARGARMLIGNHDVSGEGLIRGYFGDEAVFSRETFPREAFPGELRVRHGHEAERGMTELVRRVGPLAVPIYEHAFRLSGRGPERIANAKVLNTLAGEQGFHLFGHTHGRALEVSDPEPWANPGCFLRSAQSFLTIEGMEIALYVG